MQSVDCGQCGHPEYDHGVWMGPDVLTAVQKVRPVGCRIVNCVCGGWRGPTPVYYDYSE